MKKKTFTVEMVAHHEAGHALMGYLLGWPPTEISIVIAADGLPEGKTKYEYGEDQKYFVCEDPEGFQGEDREKCLHVLVGMYKTMWAGPYAQAHYEEGKNWNRGGRRAYTRDEEKRRNLSLIYKRYTGVDIDPMRYIMRDVAVAVDKHWHIIEELAALTIQAENMTLGREAIDTVLSRIER